jgi:hypothetical protein
MQEDDVGLGKLLPRFLGNADVDILMQGGIYESYFVAIYHLNQLISRLR